MTIISWPIEVGARELDARLLFGLRATQRGFAFASGTKASVTESVVRFPGRNFYIHKSAASRQQKRFAELARAGAQIYVHDEEGLVTDSSFKSRLHTTTLSALRRYFFYGVVQQKLFNSLDVASPISSIVSHPTYDLLSGYFSGFYAGLANINREEFGKYALITPIREVFDDQLRLAEVLVQRGRIDTVLVKPHPGGRTGAFQGLGRHFRVLPAETTIGPVLSGSEILLHSDSTTSLAASLVGIPSVNFAHPGAGPASCDTRLFGAAADQVFADISTALPSAPLLSPVESGDICHSDEKTSTDRILDVLAEDGARPEGESRIQGRTRRWFPWTPSKGLKDLSAHGRFKAGNIGPEHVLARVAAMAAALKIPEPKTRFYGDSLFLLYP